MDLSKLRLLIEVADSSLEHDLSRKAGLYARHGVAEYWVVNLNDAATLVHKRPAYGVYPAPERISFEEELRPELVPGPALRIADLPGWRARGGFGQP